MPPCPIHHCVARQPCAPSIQADPEVAVTTACSMLWIHTAPGTAIASLPWPSGSFLPALRRFVPVRRVHRRGALHPCPASLPPAPRRPTESGEELMEGAVLPGWAGIGLAQRDMEDGVWQLLAALGSGKGSGGCGGGNAVVGSKGLSPLHIPERDPGLLPAPGDCFVGTPHHVPWRSCPAAGLPVPGDHSGLYI